MGTTIFAFIVVLGVLIFFHEFGHFIIARLFGVGVEKFSLGFGPRVLGKKVGITDYRLSAVPLGGYVKMVGEEPDEPIDPDKVAISFTHQPVLQRILIVFAGPVFNILLAVFIFFGIFLVSGELILAPSVGSVTAGSPAQSAGLKPGDRIVSIDGVAVSSWDDMAEIINASNGKSLEVSVQRGDRRLVFHVRPRQTVVQNLFGESVQRFVIGISAAGESYRKRLTAWQAAAGSLVQTGRVVKLMVVIIVKMITGDISLKTIGGPLMIAQMAGAQAKAGLGPLASFIAVISINLAVINLLPIPVLDGGHLLFFAIEAVRGKPVSTRVREVAQQVGMFLLIMLMILVTYNDIIRWFFS